MDDTQRKEDKTASTTGALAGGAAGAVAGTAVGGIPGTVIGGVVGAIAGGLAGNRIAEHVDANVEEAHWRSEHGNAGWDTGGRGYDDYAPAYRTGWEGRVKYHGREFDEADADLAQDYSRFRGNDMTWEEVRPATRAAWDRVDARVRNLTRN